MITLLQLEYFKRLAANGNITKTAKELYISQAALSSMIISLERELGIKLFERSKRSIHLNEAGRTYLEYVKNIFALLDDAQKALLQFDEAKQNEVSVAVGTSLVWLPLFAEFHKSYPNFTLKQSNMSVENLSASLQSGKIDFAIAGTGDIPTEGLVQEYLKDEAIYLCVPASHTLASRTSVMLKDIKDESFISLSTGTPWRSYCNRLFQAAGFSIHQTIECDYTMRAVLISAGYGVALTSATAKDVDLLHPNKYILISDARDYIDRKIMLCSNPSRHLSRAAEAFRTFCFKTFSNEAAK